MILKMQVSILTNSVLERRFSHLHGVVVASPRALMNESGLLLSLFTKSIWSFEFVLVLVMGLANHWIFHSE